MNRLKIAILGRVNSGKSSFLNLVAGQNVSITSELHGTTTDVVEKHQEIPEVGAVTWMDTAGFGDKTSLGDKRMEKTLQVLDRADVAVLVCDGGEEDKKIVDLIKNKNLPLIKIFNKKDIHNIEADIAVNSLDLSSRDEVLNKLKAEFIKIRSYEPQMLGGLVPQGGTVVMITPIDSGAPQGRLILPQVQAIRDCLDNNQIAVITKPDQYLNALKYKPDLVIADSQVVDFMIKNTPEDIKCTTFSILMARLKGDLNKFIKGAEMIDKLNDNDKVLIAESCTHHAMDDDIGKVKIPRWLKEYTKKNLQIDFCAGHDFPSNLQEYKLVIHCGGCMFNRKEILSRIDKCEEKNVAITNYGVAISKIKGVLGRVSEIFLDKF